MAQKQVKQWITVNGKHIPIFEGESKEDAVKRVTNGNKRDKIDDGFKDIKNTHKKYEDMSDKELDDVLADEKYWSDKTEHEYEIAENIQARKKRENSKSKLNKQISKDFDEKEKQIANNKREAERLRDSAYYRTRSADAAFKAAKKHTGDSSLKMREREDGSYAIVSKQGSLAGIVKKDAKGNYYSLNIKNPGFKVKHGGASVLSLARKIVNEDIGAQEQAKLMNEMYEKTDKSIKKKDYIMRVMSEVRRLSGK